MPKSVEIVENNDINNNRENNDFEKEHEAFMKKIKTLPKKCMVCEFLDCCGGDCSHRRWIMKQDFKGMSYLCNGNKIFFKHFDDIIKNTGVSI